MGLSPLLLPKPGEGTGGDLEGYCCSHLGLPGWAAQSPFSSEALQAARGPTGLALQGDGPLVPGPALLTGGSGSPS